MICLGLGRFSEVARRSRCRLLSTRASSAASENADPQLCYDRDTGIVWETKPWSSSSPPTAQRRRRRVRPLYQTVIGIEIHAQLSIPTKLFSSAPTRHDPAFRDAPANTLVHPYDLAYPGTLPSLSLAAVRASILSAAALNCDVHRCSRFERKHYFYPDLPHGYQITQQRWPLASDGLVTFMPHFNQKVKPKKGNKKKRRRGRGESEQDDSQQESGEDAWNDGQEAEFEPRPVELRIERVQMEQDTGKTTTHNLADDDRTATESRIDYNRAGCALIEIVSHPDLRSAHEAAGVVEKIRKLLKQVGSCDGRMEEGSLRCDLNVSVAPIDDGERPPPSSREELPPGTRERVEVKNLNSLRQIVAAAEYEALRQSSSDQAGAPTGRETRTFNVKPVSDAHPLGGETLCIRAKGGSVDYRFMPEPDLPPLILDEETLGSTLEDFVEKNMPESPEEARARLARDYALAEDVADVIAGDPPAIALFEKAVATARAELPPTEGGGTEGFDSVPTLCANWLCNDLLALVKRSAAKGSGDAKDDGEGSLNHPISVEHSTVDGGRLGALVAMVANGTLTASMAKRVLAVMFEEGDSRSSPGDVAEANGWRVIRDSETLVKLCEDAVLDPRNASQLEQYRLGGKKVWKMEKFFAGRVMAASEGNAHPERMREALSVVLERLKS